MALNGGIEAGYVVDCDGVSYVVEGVVPGHPTPIALRAVGDATDVRLVTRESLVGVITENSLNLTVGQNVAAHFQAVMDALTS